MKADLDTAIVMGTKNLISNGYVRDEEGRLACGTVVHEPSANGGAQTTLIHKAYKRRKYYLNQSVSNMTNLLNKSRRLIVEHFVLNKCHETSQILLWFWTDLFRGLFGWAPSAPQKVPSLHARHEHEFAINIWTCRIGEEKLNKPKKEALYPKTLVLLLLTGNIKYVTGGGFG